MFFTLKNLLNLVFPAVILAGPETTFFQFLLYKMLSLINQNGTWPNLSEIPDAKRGVGTLFFAAIVKHDPVCLCRGWHAREFPIHTGAEGCLVKFTHGCESFTGGQLDSSHGVAHIVTSGWSRRPKISGGNVFCPIDHASRDRGGDRIFEATNAGLHINGHNGRRNHCYYRFQSWHESRTRDFLHRHNTSVVDDC